MTETISNDGWSNDNNHGLSAETHDYKSNDNPAETNPINEGFIILSDNQKTYRSSSKTTSLSAGPIGKKQTTKIKKLSNITTTATTPSKTKHKITKSSTSKTTTTTLKKTPNQTDHLTSRRGRRLLNDPSYDTENDDNDVDSFLKVSDEDLTNQLVNLAVMTDGSGFSMYQ